ncbi:zinc-ribbon domain-containing protein [Clostridium sp. AF19-22AC]|nr:zinc-ribbon domain-containing protein [Clostridium sp. AF19-22AC]
MQMRIKGGFIVYCQKCGEELQEGWKVCPVCGNKIEEGMDTPKPDNDEKQSKPDNPKGKKKSIILAAAIVLIVAIAGIGVTVIYPQVQEYQQDKKNQAEADKVIDAISSLADSEITVASEEDLNKVKTKYDALTDEQKKLVSNYRELEKAYADLKVKKDEQAAQVVIDAIEKIDANKLTDTDTSIQAMKEQFEALTDEQKGLVTNSSKLDEYAGIVQKKKEEKEAEKKAAEEAAAEAARQEAEKQAAIDNAYNSVVDKKFHKVDSQLSVEFTSTGDFVAIGYYGSAPLTNKYCTYSFSAEYALHKDVMQYLVSCNIDGIEYYFRYFTNGKISLEGDGEFSGWYELI